MTAGSEPELRHARVLIVDDEPDLADLYATWLVDSYDTTAVYTGSEALDSLDQGFDVCLLDRLLPDIPGDEVLERISDNDPDVNVAMVTPVPPGLDVIGLSFDTYLTKPVTRSELIDAVDSLLRISDYGHPFEELYAQVEKRSVLEAHVPSSVLDGNDEYAALEDRIFQLQSQSQGTLEEIPLEEFPGFMSDLSREGMETD